MGLSARDLNDMARLAQLAVNPQGTGREEIYLAVATLYRAQGPMLSERERGLMRDILNRLTGDVDATVRLSLAEKLADDPQAPIGLILILCGGDIEVVRPSILRSRKLTDEDLDRLIAEADDTATGVHTPHGQNLSAENKLVEKLAAAGQLRAGFLLRVLSQGQLDLFEAGFARLLDLGISDLRHLLYDHGPRSLALACRAVGIDRCVFPTVFDLSRKGRGMYPTLTLDERSDVDRVFEGFSRSEAMARIRAAA
jgi:uncharacterized protein (DUF2336 family)